MQEQLQPTLIKKLMWFNNKNILMFVIVILLFLSEVCLCVIDMFLCNFLYGEIFWEVWPVLFGDWRAELISALLFLEVYSLF